MQVQVEDRLAGLGPNAETGAIAILDPTPACDLHRYQVAVADDLSVFRRCVLQVNDVFSGDNENVGRCLRANVIERIHTVVFVLVSTVIRPGWCGQKCSLAWPEILPHQGAHPSRRKLRSGLALGLFQVFLGGAVAAQQLRQVLGKRRTRHDRVASRFQCFNLQVSLHVRDETH